MLALAVALLVFASGAAAQSPAPAPDAVLAYVDGAARGRLWERGDGFRAWLAGELLLTRCRLATAAFCRCPPSPAEVSILLEFRNNISNWEDVQVSRSLDGWTGE